MGSSRLPKKVAMQLGNRSTFEWVVERCKKAQSVDCWYLATSTDSIDDWLEDMAFRAGIEVFRGHSEDVLSRFSNIAKDCNPDSIVRVCSDNPFVDPGLIDSLTAHLYATDRDLVLNHRPQFGSDFIDGFGAEAFTYNALKKLVQLDPDVEEKEHVTLGFYKRSNLFSISGMKAPKALQSDGSKFDIDTLEDFQRMEALVYHGVGLASCASEILKISSTIK